MTSDLKGHMLGLVCFRLSAIGKSPSIRSTVNFEGPPVHTSKAQLQQSAKVALTPLYPSSPRAHSFKLVTRAPASASLPRSPRRSGTRCRPRQDVSLPPHQEPCAHMLPCSSMTSFHNHSSSCILAADGKVGATIWHAIIPARHLVPLEWDTSLSSRQSLSRGRGSVDPVASKMLGSSDSTSVDSSSQSLGTLRPGTLSVDNVGLPRLGSLNIRSAMAGCLSEGSWNAAWDARPARWLHGRHSAWLLFGVCACFSAAATPLMSAASSPVLTEAILDNLSLPAAVSDQPENEPDESISVAPQIERSGHGKEILTDYTVTGIPGDGRCLFRAVAHGSCLRSGKEAPDETAQRELADELRSKVADELIKRRDSTEWFIEGDFDQYIERMHQTYVWGGEPELLMLSHVLEMPITVYMTEEKTRKGLIAIAEYGQEYGKIDPIRILYHGFGHYEALQIPSNKANSKL